MVVPVSRLRFMQDSYAELISPFAPFKSDLKLIEADCKASCFDEAALRFKKIASNIKSAHPYTKDDGALCDDETMARNTFIEIAKVIDQHLQEVLEPWRYASYRISLARVKDARLALHDLKV